MHRIRLRGPWEFEPLVEYISFGERRSSGLAAPGRIQMPADWGKVLGPDFRGRVRFTRYFNCPTGLSQNQTVHLVAEQVDCHAELSINGQLLGSQDGTAGGRYDVTPYLQSRNNLTIIVELPPANAARLPRPPGRTGLPGGIPGEVRLEIE